MIQKVCPVCKGKFNVSPYLKDKKKCCSFECSGKSRRGIPCPEKRKIYMSRIAKERGFGKWMKGNKQDEITSLIKSEIAKKNNHIANFKGHRPKPRKGAETGNWKGGVSIGENRKQYRTLMAMKRRSIFLGAKGSHTNLQWNNLRKKYDYMCLCCKRCEPEVKLTRDHIIPLTKGGTNNIQNIQPLCQSCNSKKNVKTINFKYKK